MRRRRWLCDVEELVAYWPQPWPGGRFEVAECSVAQRCHANAASLALEFPGELVCVRGFALDDEHWFGHWWCVDRDGNVVDPTTRNGAVAYVGVGVVDPVAYLERSATAGSFNLELPPSPPEWLVPRLEELALRLALRRADDEAAPVSLSMKVRSRR